MLISPISYFFSHAYFEKPSVFFSWNMKHFVIANLQTLNTNDALLSLDRADLKPLVFPNTFLAQLRVQSIHGAQQLLCSRGMDERATYGLTCPWARCRVYLYAIWFMTKKKDNFIIKLKRCLLYFLKGADINGGHHEHDYTALHFAALAGKVGMCKILVENGAKIDAVNTVKRTPAQMAAFVGEERKFRVASAIWSKQILFFQNV